MVVVLVHTFSDDPGDWGICRCGADAESIWELYSFVLDVAQ
jgi:hypothetical protein